MKTKTIILILIVLITLILGVITLQFGYNFESAWTTLDDASYVGLDYDELAAFEEKFYNTYHYARVQDVDDDILILETEQTSSVINITGTVAVYNARSSEQTVYVHYIYTLFHTQHTSYNAFRQLER